MDSIKSAERVNGLMKKSKKVSFQTVNLLYVPMLCLFLVFVIYPLCKGIFLSFTNWNGYSQSYSVIGADNYLKFFKDAKVLTAFKNTIVYGFGSTILQNILGLGFALFLNQAFRGKSVIRTIIYLPVMIAPLIMGYIMYFFVMYDGGALNDIRMLFGAEALDWMSNGSRSVLIMTLINSFQYAGISMVIYLAGLQNIPTMYYEAAELDGAGNLQQFKFITFPLLTPAISSAVILNLIGGLKLFDVIMALTSGGPGSSTHSLSTLVHRTYFGGEQAGYASAIGIMAFIFIMIVSNVFMKYFDKKEVDV